MSYGIFVKSVQGNKLAVKMFVGDHEMMIMPDEHHTKVAVDGDVVEQHEKGVVVPKDEPNSYAMK